MKRFFLPLFILIISLNVASTQTFLDDSTALVKIYNMAGGANWTNSTNWLTNAPVSSWHGITMSNGRVSKIDLGGNNLSGEIPSDINNITQLLELKLDANFIEILPNINPISLDLLELVEAKNNKLTFEDWEHNIDIITDMGISVVYFPQDSVGMPQTYNKGVGHEQTFSVTVGGDNNSYQWYKDGAAIAGATSTTLTLDDLELDDAGAYYCAVTTDEPELSSLTIYSHVEQLNISSCFDALGGVYPCDEMIVKFVPGTSDQVKINIRNEFGAAVIDSCRCNYIEVWDLPDSVTLEGPGGRVAQSEQKVEVESAGLNYDIFLPSSSDNSTVPPGFPSGNTNGSSSKVTIAIIDSGIDYLHPSLSSYIWLNSGEMPIASVGDNDGNCYEDDFMGWNFVDEDKTPYDFNGHGTHVAGSVINGLGANQVELMNLKITDGNKGSLFDATCAVYYAIDKDADLINASWGYQGLSSPILEAAVEEAGTSCGILFTTSAGNNNPPIDNDALPHYPSNFPFDNILSVANCSAAGVLATDSRYGFTTVDLAAEGIGVNSTWPGGGFMTQSGTSMAAAKVSHAAVVLKNATPNASFRGIKHCILSEVDVFAGSLGGKVVSEGKLNESNAQTCITSDPNASECGALLTAKVFLEGPYESSTGLMIDSLRSLNLIPLNQPYNTPPWNYPGSESITVANLMITGNDAIVDWILIRYLDPNNIGSPNTVAGLLQRDGDIVNTAGQPINLGNIVNAGNIAIIHRNHLGVMTDFLVDFNYHPTSLSFAEPAFPVAGGFNSTKINGAIKLVKGGDASKDGALDIPNDLDLNFIPQNGTSPNYNNTADFDLNGRVNTQDKNAVWYPNYSTSSSSSCPGCY